MDIKLNSEWKFVQVKNSVNTIIHLPGMAKIFRALEYYVGEDVEQ